MALVDALDMVRSKVNFKRLSLTDIKIDIKRIPKKKDLIQAMDAAEEWFGVTDSEIGTKAEKAMKKNMKRASTNKPSQGADFLTGKSRHFGYIEFESPEVAKIVADTMHNYLLFEHLLQVHVVPPEQVHPRLWRGFSYRHKPLNYVQIELKRHDKERTLEEHKKLVERIRKHDQNRRKRIEAAGVDYECPEIVGNIQPAPKKIKFDD